MNVYAFSNGNTAVCGDDGQQIAELQESWLLAIVDRLGAAGYDPRCARYYLPGNVRAKVFATNDGLNWQIVRD